MGLKIEGLGFTSMRVIRIEGSGSRVWNLNLGFTALFLKLQTQTQVIRFQCSSLSHRACVYIHIHTPFLTT